METGSENDLPKSPSWEVADQGTRSHTFRLKTALFTEHCRLTTGQRTTDPMPRSLSPEWAQRSGNRGHAGAEFSVLPVLRRHRCLQNLRLQNPRPCVEMSGVDTDPFTSSLHGSNEGPSSKSLNDRASEARGAGVPEREGQTQPQDA